MACIRSRNTKPELAVRKVLHCLGFRYRLHIAQMPGTPDIVLPKHKAVVLVQGCFWHGHICPKRQSQGKNYKLPSANADYWKTKIAGNVARDKRNIAALKALGWRVFVIWECSMQLGVQRVVDALRDKKEAKMKGTPTQKQGNVSRQNKDGTRDKSGDGVELPKYTPQPSKKK